MGSKRFSARDRQTQSTTWATVSFILESAVFLGMGYQLPTLVDAAAGETTPGRITALTVVVIGLLVGLRFLGLALPALIGRMSPEERGHAVRARLDRFEHRLESRPPTGDHLERRLAWARRRLARSRADVDFEQREPITGRGFTVLGWAGMRGVVTVAAAQTIPSGTPQRDTVVLAAFFVALVTLVAFGLTLPALINRFDFESISEQDRRDAVQALLRRVGASAIDAVGPIEEQQVDGEPVDAEVVTTMKETIVPRLVSGIRALGAPRLDRRDQLEILQRRYLEAMRDALVTERAIGVYSSDTYRQVETLIDGVEQRLHLS